MTALNNASAARILQRQYVFTSANGGESTRGTKKMKQLEPIVVSLTSTDQLVERSPPSPFRRRRLKEEAEQFLVERINALPRYAAARLLITLCQPDVAKENIVVEAIHEHFNCLRVETEAKLKRMRRFGWRSFAVAIAFLTVTIAIVQLMKRYLRSGTLSSDGDRRFDYSGMDCTLATRRVTTLRALSVSTRRTGVPKTRAM
jgi:hypothetical protein